MPFKTKPLISLLVLLGLILGYCAASEAIPVSWAPTVTLTSPTGRGSVTLSTNNPSCLFMTIPGNLVPGGVKTSQRFFQPTRMLLESDLPEQDPANDYPFGLVEFTLDCSGLTTLTATAVSQTPALAAVDVTMTFSDAGDMSGYRFRKYGPTPDNEAYHWYDFGWDGSTGVVGTNGNSVTLRYVDGERGDDYPLMQDNMIVDQMGATPIPSVPTTNEWGMLIFVMLAGAGSVYYLRKRQRA